MDIIEIILATIVGTLLMTGFSYAVSSAYHKLFKEPVLLNALMLRLGIHLEEHRKSAAGWVVHFLFGLLFVLAYDIIWRNTFLDPTWFCGLLFGMISGVIGIIGWMILFRIPNKPPRVHFKQYYIQLFFAHIIFGLAVAAVYKLYA